MKNVSIRISLSHIFYAKSTGNDWPIMFDPDIREMAGKRGFIPAGLEPQNHCCCFLHAWIIFSSFPAPSKSLAPPFSPTFHWQSAKEVYEISLLLDTCSDFLLFHFTLIWLPFIVGLIKVYLPAPSCISSSFLRNLKKTIPQLSVCLSFIFFPPYLPPSQYIPQLNCLVPHCHSPSIDCTGLVSER